MPTELQLIEGTILSLTRTVNFHADRGVVGVFAMASATKHLDAAMERLAVEKTRLKLRAIDRAAERRA